MIYYVYAYYEPGCAEPFYIGKGHGDRAYRHLKICYGQKTVFHKKLKSLLDGGFQPEIEILADGLSEFEALHLEKQLILKFGRKDLGTGCLYNCTDGGEGFSGGIRDEEFRRKLSLRSLGVRPSKETRIKLGRASEAAWTDERRREQSLRMRQNRINKAYSDSLKKPIACLIGGEITRRFESIREVRKAGFSHSPVIQCLKGRRKTAYGREWRYL